jgi:transcriptional regulator with XRE-family HTH domain
MAKKEVHTFDRVVEDDVSDSPQAIHRQEFGRRLQQKILSKGWRQSDLARATDIGKDSISHYVRGRSLPGPKALNTMAKALGVSVADLLPNAPAAAMDEELPALELRQAAGHPGMVWLRVNRALSFAVAAKIIDLIQADDEARKR